MIIAHLPAGYLAARAAVALGAPAIYWGLLAGSLAPDLDMLWFVFVDGGQVHHHDYLTHRPVVWLCVALLGTALRRAWLLGLGLGGMLHLLLDSIAGKIAWGWPLWSGAEPLVVVPATYENWVLSFLFHWTFAVEIAMVTLSLVVLRLRGLRP